MLNRDHKMVNNHTEKAKMFNKYFYSIFEKNQDDAFISQEDDSLFNSLPTKEDLTVLNRYKLFKGNRPL